MRRFLFIAVMVAGGMATMAASSDPPPVILDLGPVVPTPAPTPEVSTRKRLITTLTVQNAAGVDSVMNFECTDVADAGKGKFHTLAAARYSLSDDNPKLKEVRARIIAKIRDLEHDLLDYAKIAGPPKDRQSLITFSGDESGQKNEKEK